MNDAPAPAHETQPVAQAEPGVDASSSSAPAHATRTDAPAHETQSAAQAAQGEQTAPSSARAADPRTDAPTPSPEGAPFEARPLDTIMGTAIPDVRLPVAEARSHAPATPGAHVGRQALSPSERVAPQDLDESRVPLQAAEPTVSGLPPRRDTAGTTAAAAQRQAAQPIEGLAPAGRVRSETRDATETALSMHPADEPAPSPDAPADGEVTAAPTMHVDPETPTGTRGPAPAQATDASAAAGETRPLVHRQPTPPTERGAPDAPTDTRGAAVPPAPSAVREPAGATRVADATALVGATRPHVQLHPLPLNAMPTTERVVPHGPAETHATAVPTQPTAAAAPETRTQVDRQATPPERVAARAPTETHRPAVPTQATAAPAATTETRPRVQLQAIPPSAMPASAMPPRPIPTTDLVATEPPTDTPEATFPTELTD
ncbi:MAG: hypothetical protein ACJ77E_03495, partial [Gaiellaceae bacterium]